MDEARTIAHEHYRRFGGCLTREILTHAMPHTVSCDALTAAIQALIDEKDGEREGIWEGVLGYCQAAWPGKQLCYNDSPLELITDIINERDEKDREIAELTEKAEQCMEAEDTAGKQYRRAEATDGLLMEGADRIRESAAVSWARPEFYEAASAWERGCAAWLERVEADAQAQKKTGPEGPATSGAN